MKLLVICIACWLAMVSVISQEPYDSVLKQIEAANPTLKVLRLQTEASKTTHQTGIQMPNPEIEFNYLWGNTVAPANRLDFSISQSFDFPTVYVFKHKLAEMEGENEELKYRAERVKLLTRARKLLIDLTSVNAKLKVYNESVVNSRKLVAAVEKRYNSGDASVLEYNKARLNLLQEVAAYDKMLLDQLALQSELNELNGGGTVDWKLDRMITSQLPSDFESWYAQVAALNPLLMYVHSRVEIENRKIQLRKAETLPRFSTGYMSEQVGFEKFQGVSVGVSIPLWENKNKVKQSKLHAQATQLEADRVQQQFYNNLRVLHQQYNQLLVSVAHFRSTLGEFDSSVLIDKAYDGGHLSLSEYLFERDYYTGISINYIDMVRELGMCWAELKALEL